MSDLISKFDNLTLGSSDEEKNTLHGYICKIKSSKLYFECEDNYFVISDQSGSKFILCQRKFLAKDAYISCLNCKNQITYENMKNIDDVKTLKSEYCEHAKVCEILFGENGKKQHNRQEHYIEILLPGEKSKQTISLVHPADESAKMPGIIVVNSRSTKPKCHTFN